MTDLYLAEQAALSDTGRQRRGNEDSLLQSNQLLFAVADGMGGAQAGEVASKLAVETLQKQASALLDRATTLSEVVQQANEAIFQSAKSPDLKGMGTTVTACLMHGDRLEFAHVGDSRAYLIRGGELQRLTQDHSLVEELLRRGKLTEQEAAEHPQRSIITRALGPEQAVEVDSFSQELEAGDIYLLCSDGLTTMIDDHQIAEIITGARSLKQAASQLVAAANLAGGRDNISVVLLRVASRSGAGSSGGLRAPSRARRLLRLSLILSMFVVPIGFSAWFATRSVFFLSSDSGTVAIYRGLPYELPFGIKLYSDFYHTGVTVEQLSDKQRKQLLDHRLRSQRDTTELVNDLELDLLDK